MYGIRPAGASGRAELAGRGGFVTAAEVPHLAHPFSLVLANWALV